MKICRYPAGMIGPGRTWVLEDWPYLYCAESLPGLIWQVVRYWRSDYMIVG